MRALAPAGAVALLFGLGSFWATGHLGVFGAANLAGGALALLTAVGLGARRLRGVGGPHSRRLIARGLGRIALALGLAVAAERLADAGGWRFDGTVEQSFDPSEATRKALAALPGPATARLFYDPFDPRKRRTRLLLDTLARHGPLEVREHALEEAPELEDRFAVGSSNTVVIERDDRFELVERPTEGALYEALVRLERVERGALGVLAGAGGGDPERTGPLGYSGLGAALETEGYAVRRLVLPAQAEIPEELDAVLALAPRRRLPPEALASLRRFLARGGGLVAFLEPGAESGIESLLAEYGIDPAPGLVIDPASGALDGDADGVGILASRYETHPATKGLDRNRMTFFPGARSLVLRKPDPGDELRRLVMTSPRSWQSDDLTLLDRGRSLPDRGDAREDYHAIAAVGRYPRAPSETRIAVFGDADFASNRQLRTLYNLDLALNTVHWVVQREADIVLRPKLRRTVQFPLPVASTLHTFYGVGLLVPELLLIAALVVWARGRS